MEHKKDLIFYHILALFVLGCLFCIRFQYIFWDSFWSDEALYSWIANKIYQNPAFIFSPQAFSPLHPPLYASILALSRHFLNFLPVETAYRFFSFITYILGIAAIYILGTRFKDRFVGVFCAVCLAFNTVYFFYSARILIDIPFVAVCCMLFASLLDRQQNQTCRQLFVIGFWGMIAILLKSSGAILIPVTTLYLMFYKDMSNFASRIKEVVIPLTVMMCTYLWEVYLYRHYGLHVPGPGTTFAFSLGFDQIKTYLKVLLYLLKFPNIFVLFAYGALVCLTKQPWHKKFLLTLWIGIFFFALVFSPSSEYPRYVLQLLPFLILTAGLGFEFFISHFKKWRNILRAMIVLACCLSLYETDQKMNLASQLFTEYQTPAKIVNEIASPGSLVITNAPRPLCYFTDMDFLEFGGGITGLLLEKDEFKRLVEKSNRDVLLVIDEWGGMQPTWAEPFTQDSENFLKELNFKHVSTITMTDKILKIKDFPIFRIYKRPKN